MFIPLACTLLATSPQSAQTTSAPGWVRVWTDRETPYDQGDPATVVFELAQPAYVTALRVDTDGRVQVLLPRTPWGDTHAVAHRAYEITGYRSDHSFRIDDAAGVGYVFVIASAEPFDYTDLARDDHWDYRVINGGWIRGDPYVALTDLAERIVPRGAYDYDIASYHVGRRYDYPRFVCSECHSHPRNREWDEYRLRCARFRLVIYDDPVYDAYRAHHGRNVVIDRPLHPGPRFLFRDATPGSTYVTRLQGRPSEADRRRTRELSPVRPLIERHRAEERREDRRKERRREAVRRRRPTDADNLAPADSDSKAQPSQRPSREPRSSDDPERRRRQR